MKDVIWYSNWYYVLWDKDKKHTQYRLIKVWDKYVVQKWFTFTNIDWWETTNYSDITDILDYDTAKAKMYILQWKYEVIEEFSV